MVIFAVIERPVNSQISSITRQTDRQTDGQTDIQTDTSTGWRTDRHKLFQATNKQKEKTQEGRNLNGAKKFNLDKINNASSFPFGNTFTNL